MPQLDLTEDEFLILKLALEHEIQTLDKKLVQNEISMYDHHKVFGPVIQLYTSHFERK